MILRDHSKESIIQAMEENITAFTALLPKTNPNYEKKEFNDLIRVITGLNNPVVNWIVRVRFNEQNAETRIRENLEYFSKKQLPVMWFISPNVTPSNILFLLKKAGVKVPRNGSPGMAYDLRTITDKDWEEALTSVNCQITKVESPTSLKLWAKVFQEGFSFSDQVTQICLSLFTSLWPHFVCFLVTIDEEPVAISSVFYQSGVAGIYNVATIPDYRDKGYGTVATLAPMIDAQKRGYEIAWLESSEMGLNLYRKIGYREYCQFYRCIYTPNE